ncbi:MAG: HD domain-containing protein [Desulfatiglandales bacterium]
MIPSVEECFKFMEKYRMLGNIKAHSIMVEKVAHMIARGLRDAGVDVSLEKITAGALMHDIGKTPSLDTGDDHEARGREICLQNHLDEITGIVGEHVRLKNYRPDEAIKEKEIVYYADKRVNHDEVVTLEERLKYLLRRYGKNQEHVVQSIKKNFTLCEEVERKLFAKLKFKPEHLAEMIK